MGIPIVVPVVTFIMLFFCPETPVWLLSKGRVEEAKSVLKRLRGAKNIDIIQDEMERISTNLQMNKKSENPSISEKLKQFFQLAIDPTFMKPFCLLLVIFCLGFEWAGFAAIGFYMVPLLM